jgi:hypothetical protein
MFSRIRDRNRERAFGAGAQIAAEFELLRSDAPGAAYLFARTLVNYRPLVDDPATSSPQKIEAIEAHIAASDYRGDDGICVLAMKFTRHLIDVQERDIIASYGYSMAFGEIAKAGEQYRDVQPRDRKPPIDEVSRGILAKQGRTCVAQVADAVMSECDSIGADRERAKEDIATILALFDLRDEASSGRLSRLSALGTKITEPAPPDHGSPRANSRT